ncbi:hypothetical protein ACFL3T_02055 [Patescibacteria group bacterium]
MTPCNFLEVEEIKDRALSAANCTIHDKKRPDICEDFTNSQFGGPCTRGLFFWKEHVDRNLVDLDKIPEKVRLILEGIYSRTS